LHALNPVSGNNLRRRSQEIPRPTRRGDKMTRASDGEWVKAAVLDASYLDEGRTNIGDIERLAAGIEARGAELWIPEVLVLELPGHQRAS
jgi:hypothetical protein